MQIKVNKAFFYLMVGVQLIASLFQQKNIRQFYQNRQQYPIKQLSPRMTLIQSAFFLILQIALIFWVFFVFCHNENPFLLDYCDKTNQEIKPVDKNSQISFLKILAALYLFSRGCCFGYAILKTWRICEAYINKRLRQNSLRTRVLQKEFLLVILGMGYGFVGFVLVSYLTTKYRFHQDFECSLFIYEQNYFGVMINSLVEEGLALYLMNNLQAKHMSNQLYKLNYTPLAVYMIWFIGTSLLAKLPYDVSIYIVFSFWIRAHFMFYFYITVPLQQIEENPTIYIKKEDILNFKIITNPLWQNFYQDTKIILSFEKYLENLDENNLSHSPPLNIQESFQRVSQLQIYKHFLVLQKQIDHQRNDEILDQLVIKFAKYKEVYESFPDPQALFESWGNHLGNIYQIYCKTMAFKALISYYDQNEIFLGNLKTLGIPVIQFDQIAQFRTGQQ